MFKQAINTMGDTIEDRDIKKEQKGNKKEILEKKITFFDCKVIEEMDRLGLNKLSSKRKGDLKITNKKKTITRKFSNESFALTMTYL